jgi:hypothetical protein
VSVVKRFALEFKMVAAILLQKKRLVDILEEACDLDPLNGAVAGDAAASSSLINTGGLGVVTLTNSPTSNNNKRRRNSLSSRSNACSKDSSLYISPSFASDSSVTDQSASTRASKVRFATSPPQVRYFSNYLPSMTEKDREQVRTSIWYTVRSECDATARVRVRARFVHSVGRSRCLLCVVFPLCVC